MQGIDSLVKGLRLSCKELGIEHFYELVTTNE